ncbi:uncharacterized protein EAE97_010176 [Botrytis byssoidea]|uniref:Uncharacterized protein n=1 Tax=Botrytis byssoidea TaxID=139641 RepID=A0A9P5I4F3_9HELO|nr:uncharacterized protein EAE97_010176 [Botrytis byssoidea]KAF7926667.1 hypothetical protein EAE97_010176 [Botrytis byssoidea]
MESSSWDNEDSGFSHDREMEYMGGNMLKQPSQAIISTFTSTSTPNPSPTSSHSSPKLLQSSTSASASASASYSNSKPPTPQPPTTSSNTFSNFPFSSTALKTAPKISITTSIDSLISIHQHRNMGLLLTTRDLVASPVEDFILGSPLEGFM